MDVGLKDMVEEVAASFVAESGHGGEEGGVGFVPLLFFDEDKNFFGCDADDEVRSFVFVGVDDLFDHAVVFSGFSGFVE